MVRIKIDQERLAAFCRRWKIAQLALFGSAVRGDSRPDSDIDLLVTFSAGADWSVLYHFRMEEELEQMLGRSVDLVSDMRRSPQWAPSPRSLWGSGERLGEV